jgi:hypothetical protein
LTEITAPIALCDARGNLNRAAIGWSRRPLHTCELTGRFPNKRRWHHWGVVDRDVYATITLADIDLFMVAAVMVVDLASGKKRQWVGGGRRGGSQTWPKVPGTGRAQLHSLGLTIDLEDRGDETRLFATTPGVRIDVTVSRPEALDTMNVVVAPSDDAFLFTSKQMALPARGAITWGKRRWDLTPDAFAGLDWARGVWPAGAKWRWGCGAGTAGGHQVVVSIGAEWTDDAPVNENAFVIDGRLQKVDAHHTITRADGPKGSWRLEGPQADLTFSPHQRIRPGANLGVVAAVVDHSVGTFTGTIVPNDGAPLTVALTGWCEEVRLGLLT